MQTLVYFGNYNLQKDIYKISIDGTRNLTGNDVQTQDVARANGTTVVNTRLTPKSITLQGTLQSSASSQKIRKTISDFDYIFNTTESNFLRVEEDWQEVIPTTTTAGWTTTLDATGLALNTTDYELTTASLGFTADVSTNTANIATITYTGSTVALNSYTDPSLNFSLFADDTYYINSIDVKFGTDSSNYYQATNITQNYEGKQINNGVNKFSLLLASMTTAGTVNTASIGYFQLSINYATDAEDINFRLNPIIVVDEKTTRNFPVYRSGEITRAGLFWMNNFERFTANFINYTGISQSTHQYNLLTAQTITGSVATYKFSLDGNTTMSPLFTTSVKTATSVDSMSFTNLQTGKKITLDLSDITADDTITFGGLDFRPLLNGNPLDSSEGFVPFFEPGINRVQVAVNGESSATVPTPAIVSNTERSQTPPITTNRNAGRMAMQFTATQTGIINTIDIRVRAITDEGFDFTTSYDYVVVEDNSNEPTGTVLASGSFNLLTGQPMATVSLSGLGVSVTTASKYWVMIPSGTRDSESFIYRKLFWEADSTGAYAGGIGLQCKDGNSDMTVTTATWEAVSGDLYFTTTITVSPAWNLEVNSSYNKLHVA